MDLEPSRTEFELCESTKIVVFIQVVELVLWHQNTRFICNNRMMEVSQTRTFTHEVCKVMAVDFWIPWIAALYSVQRCTITIHRSPVVSTMINRRNY